MELLYVLMVIVILALLFYVYKTEEENIKLRAEMRELKSFKTRKDMLERVAKIDQYKNRWRC
jgi:Tfp pilus assembly protein PilO